MSAIKSYNKKNMNTNIFQTKKTYLIAYDFNDFDNKQSTNVRDYLDNINGTQILESTWIVKTALTITRLNDELLSKKRFDSDDQFIVVQITDYVLAKNLMNDVSNCFK